MFRSFVDEDQHGEVLSETAQGKHVVARIPLTIWDQVQHVTFVRFSRALLFEGRIPNARFSIFRPRHQILRIWWNSTSNHQIFALSSKETLLDTCSSWRFVFDQSDTVVSWLHKELVLCFRMDNERIYLISIQLFVRDLEMILNFETPVTHRNVPSRNSTTRITRKKTSWIAEHETIRVDFVKNSSFLIFQVLVNFSLLFRQFLLLGWTWWSIFAHLNLNFLLRTHDQLQSFIVEVICFVDASFCAKSPHWFLHDWQLLETLVLIDESNSTAPQSNLLIETGSCHNKVSVDGLGYSIREYLCWVHVASVEKLTVEKVTIIFGVVEFVWQITPPNVCQVPHFGRPVSRGWHKVVIWEGPVQVVNQVVVPSQGHLLSPLFHVVNLYNRLARLFCTCDGKILAFVGKFNFEGSLLICVEFVGALIWQLRLQI